MLVKLRNVNKAYGESESATYQLVLDKLSLEIQEGESLAITGPSGSGKSTLLNIIGTLDFADSGDLLYRGRNLSELRGTELDNFRNKEIGFVFQDHHLLPQCNVLENVLIPTLVNKGNTKENEKRAEELLRRVGLWEHAHKRPGQLSGGECQRVAVVRALINSPSLILADEPTGALDSKNARAVAELLIELNKENGISLLMVSHSREIAEMTQSVYYLNAGALDRI